MRHFRKSNWEPYIGPQGGEGWRNTETDEIAYQAQPPGGVQMPDEFPGEFLDMGEGGMPDSVIEAVGDEIVIASDGEGNITIDELDNISSEGFIYGFVELNQEARDELGLDTNDPMDDLFGEEGEHAQEPSAGTWDEIDSNDLGDVPEGTEVSFEHQGDVITGELEIYDGGNVTEYLIDGIPLTYADLAPADAEVYVNEETLPDENIDVYDNIEDVESGADVSIVYDDGEVQEGEFLGDTGSFSTEYTLDMDGTEVTIDEEYVDFIEVENEEDGELGDFEDYVADDLEEGDDGTGAQQTVLDSIDSKYTNISTEEYTFEPEEIKDYEFSHKAIEIFNSVNGVIDVVGYDTADEFLKDPPEGVVPGEIQQFLNHLENEFGSDDADTIVEGEFNAKDLSNLGEGSYVEIETIYGNSYSGTVDGVGHDNVQLQNEDGSDGVKLYSTDVDSGNAYTQKPSVDEDATQDTEAVQGPTQVPDNASADEIFEVMQTRIASGNSLDFGWKNDTADILVEAFENGATATEMRWSIEKLSQEYSFRKEKIEDISSAMMTKFTTESEFVGGDVSFHRDSLGTINKLDIFKSFREKYPEYAEDGDWEDPLKDIKDIISSWTGGSKSPDSAPLWALAVEEGKANLPRNIADEVDTVSADEINMIADYVDHTRDVLRDIYGDSITLFRGISGSYGSDRARDAKRSKETTIDHRAISSWSINPALAQDFARTSGTVACKEVDVDDMYVATFNRAGFTTELEVVASGGVEEYDYERTAEKLEPGKVIDGGRIGHFSGLEVFLENLNEYAL